jgi:hypothetical protein
MIISTNREPGFDEFKELIDTVTSRLNDDAAKRASYYLERKAQLLEDDVLAFLNEAAEGTKFAGTIEKISGQRFPDIVAGKYFGVEVKSSKDENWTTLGGSVNESTRIENVERIFLTLGRLVEPIEFRSRPYEECLSDVVVTHYPRYKINMNLKSGETIFDKMETTYDELRLSDNPIGMIVDFYKSQLKPGESLWWTGKAIKDEQPKEMSMKIRLCRTLSAKEKKDLKVKGLALFPEVTGDSSAKYERFSLWLVANHSVVSTSTRDLFSAGGQGDINAAYRNIPRVIMNINDNKGLIHEIINNTEESILRETWNVKDIEPDRLGQWINLISMCCKLKNNDIRLVMKTIFNRK